MIQICQTLSVKSKFVSMINQSIYVNNELKRTRTNSNCMSSFQFVPVHCLDYLWNRRMLMNPRASAQSAFHSIPSAFIRVHLRLAESNITPQQRAQSIATIIFASFALFAVRFINSLNELSSSAQPSSFIEVHPRSTYRTAPAEGR